MANDVSSVFSTFLLQLSKSLLFENSSYVDDFSVELSLNLQLQQIDLSSLESISSGGVLSFNNPQLCYVGNLTTYLDNPTAQHQCIVPPFRRDPQACSESCVVPPLLHNVTLVLIGPTSSLLSYGPWCLADVIHIHELLTNLILLFNLKLAVNT